MGYNVHAVAAGTDTKQSDARGAFIPGAQKFANALGGSYRTFDNSKNARRNFLDKVNEGQNGLDVFAYFGHGWKTQLGSADIFTDEHLTEFADVLRPKMKPNAAVVLYACWSGIENGFTKLLQEKLGSGIWVYGHTTAGHSFMNPDVSEMQPSYSPNYSLYYPIGHDLRAAWADALKYSDMWIRFPIMWQDFITLELYAVRLLGQWRVGQGNSSPVYEFKWERNNRSFESLSDINAYPAGTVKTLGASTRMGLWTIQDQGVVVNWNDGATELWPLPLRSQGTQVNIGNQVISATRIKRNLPGKLQG
jgi:hypothetical protein